MKFGVRTAEPLSAAKKVLLALQPGDELTATSVGGDFVLSRDPQPPGAAGRCGHRHHAVPVARLPPARLQERDAVLVLLARSADDVAYADELRASGVRVLVRTADGSAPPSGLDAAPAGNSRLDAAGAEGPRPGHRGPRGVRLRLARQRGVAAPRGAPGRGTARPRGLLLGLLMGWPRVPGQAARHGQGLAGLEPAPIFLCGAPSC